MKLRDFAAKCREENPSITVAEIVKAAKASVENCGDLMLNQEVDPAELYKLVGSTVVAAPKVTKVSKATKAKPSKG